MSKDWKKQLNRFAQMANQGFGLSEKTDVLSKTLLDMEQRLTDVKQMCQQTSSRLGDCLISSQGDYEKRIKKLPLMLLASTLTECGIGGSQVLFDILRQTVAMIGRTQETLARELVHYEMDVESKVIQPIKNISEKDLSSVVKSRKQLDKYILDMDSARNRAKRDETMKDDYEEAKMRVEQAQDQFAAELYSFASREEEFCQVFLALIEAEAEYHRKSLQAIEQARPRLMQQIESQVSRPVFKMSLQSHLLHTGREISVVIERCVGVLYEHGLEEEGLFRMAGGKNKVARLKAAFDANMADLEEFNVDVHCVADVLKQYLRTLPEPLMTFDLYSDWMSISQIPQERRLNVLKATLDKLPKANYDNLRYLIKFLAKIVEHSDVNKMSSSNLSIVIGPNLLWPREDRGTNLQFANISVELLITNANWFFPEAVDFRAHAVDLSSDSSPLSVRRQHHPVSAENPMSKLRTTMSNSSTANMESEVSLSATVISPQSSADLLTFDPNVPPNYGDLKKAAAKFQDMEELDNVSVDFDASPKSSRKRRAPAPPVATPVQQVETTTTTTTTNSATNSKLQPSSNLEFQSPSPTLSGHRRAASANIPNAADRPHYPPPAPPRKPERPAPPPSSQDHSERLLSRSEESLPRPDYDIGESEFTANAATEVGSVSKDNSGVSVDADTSTDSVSVATNKNAEARAKFFQIGTAAEVPGQVNHDDHRISGYSSTKRTAPVELKPTSQPLPALVTDTMSSAASSRESAPVASPRMPAGRSDDSSQPTNSTFKMPDVLENPAAVAVAPVARPRPPVQSHYAKSNSAENGDVPGVDMKRSTSSGETGVETRSDISPRSTAATTMKKPPPPIAPRHTTKSTIVLEADIPPPIATAGSQPETNLLDLDDDVEDTRL